MTARFILPASRPATINRAVIDRAYNRAIGKRGDNMTDHRTVAYFSMEIGLEAAMPTYSGGLGVLAGDTIRSAADLNVPLVSITLLHRKGYFYQRLDAGGWQSEEPVEWVVEQFLEEL